MKKDQGRMNAAGDKSLLQTARTKNFGVGKFALLSLKSKPQPPVKKIKIHLSQSKNIGATNNSLVDDASKVSDITAPSNEKKGAIKGSTATNGTRKNEKLNDIEVESSVLGMSVNSKNSFDFSLSKAYIQGPTTPTRVAKTKGHTEKKQNVIQSTAFSTLWSAPTTTVHLKNQKFAKSQIPKKQEVAKKKTMDISEGLRFSAPAPMTLNRYQPQMGQEKTAPESREYLEMQESRKQKRVEAQRMADAKYFVEERLNKAFMSEVMEAGFDHFDSENKNLVGNMPMKKKSLIKKILGKVRPQPSQKSQLNHEKSSAIQAAMSAAAAAVEVATGNHSVVHDERNKPLSEKEARAIVNQAITVSRQRKKDEFTGISAVVTPFSKRNNEYKVKQHEVISGVDQYGRQVQFPVDEVMMKVNEDSVSDLDASIRNLRKIPLVEIHMKDAKQCHGDESVSTLGTPRVFEQLDKLLLSEPRRFQQQQQQPDLITDFLEDNMGGSAAPPPMVTSHDARALIDQLDSGTMAGDMTAGTLRAENAVQFCNLATNCFNPDQRSFFLDSSNRIGDNSNANSEESYDDSETSSLDKTSNDETWSSPTPAFTQAIDNAIRKAESQIATNHTERQKRDDNAHLSFAEEVGELISSPYGSEIAVRESKSRSASPQTIPTSSQIEIISQPDQQHKANFDSFMKIAASKLNTVTEADDESRQEEHRRDRYSTEIDHSSRDKMNRHGNDATPRARGGIKEQSFEQPSGRIFSDDQFNLLSAKESGSNHIRDITQLNQHPKTKEHNTSKRKKVNSKSSIGIHTLGGLMTNQGRFLLEKDDEYWDTLSTIASTANDRSAENNIHRNDRFQPGPIPGEITTSSSEIKSITASVDTENFKSMMSSGISAKNTFDPRKYSSPSDGKLDEMINDVTDLIDADLLDNLPISKDKKSIDRMPLKLEKYSNEINQKQLKRVSHTMTKKVLNQIRPSPERVDRSKVDESQSGSLSIAASQIAKGIRSVSWGFEEIYEDRNSQLDLSKQDTNFSESSRSTLQRAQPCPEGTQANPESRCFQTRDDEDFITRTFELSKGLLETIMGSQIVQDKNEMDEEQSARLKESRNTQFNINRQTTNRKNTEYRDDYDNEQLDLSNSSENDLSPAIQSRLESLRNQRSRALMKFRQIQKMEPTTRDRERLKAGSMHPDFSKSSGKDDDQIASGNYQQDTTRMMSNCGSDIDLKYTTSDSNDSITPSQRARDLRMQLNEAMRASREIQISQNQLGNELNSFKKKYYRNPEIRVHKF